MTDYDVVIIGAGPGGIYAAFELVNKNINNKDIKICVIDSGKDIYSRKCPIIEGKVNNCIKCSTCSIMNGFGGAGAFSDGKYVISTEYGGDLHRYIGTEAQAVDLMNYVDLTNKMFLEDKSTSIPDIYDSKNISDDIRLGCLRNGIHILQSKIRHLGTDLNYKILVNMYEYLKDKVTFMFNTVADTVEYDNSCFNINIYNNYEDKYISSKYCIVAVGRSGSNAVKNWCKDLGIKTTSNKVDIGVRVELPYEIFSHITDKVYEGKFVYRTKQYNDSVRTFCMNPKGEVVTENTNDIITVNGHSYEKEELKSNNTNFALLVSKHLTEPFDDSTEYGQSIAKLSNMLGNGVIVQRFGDLIRGQRSTDKRIAEGFVKPTLNATPGDLSLVMPKRFLDDIIETIYALDKIAPGTASDDTLLYGVEVKYYNMVVDVDNNLETKIKNLYMIGDGSGVTHSLAQASASGVYVARKIMEKENN